jgi:hypothetical protein
VFLKFTPQKKPGMISKRYPPKTDYGKKPPILSCDPATLGVDAADRKCTAPKECYQIAFDSTFFEHLVLGRPLWYVRAIMQRPYHIFGTRDRKTSFDATDFLRSNDRMASLLPTAMRMARPAARRAG